MGNELQRAKYTFMEGCRGKELDILTHFLRGDEKKKKRLCNSH